MIDVTIGDRPQEPPESKETPRKTASARPSLLADLTRHHIAFAIAALIYLYFSLSAIGLTYIDFGDGNYLYLSWQLSQGQKLYVDLPSPQPPLHLFLGALLIKMGGGSLVVARTFQAILRIATGALVWAVTGTITGSRLTSALAGIIYIWLPEGVWWSRGYQSEPLLIFFQCLQLFLFLKALKKPRPGFLLVAAGVIGSLAVYTNMTAVPYLGLQILYLAYRYRPRLLPFRRRKPAKARRPRAAFFWVFLFALALPSLLFFVLMSVYSQGQYWTQIWTRQVGTFPTDSIRELLGYSASSLLTEWGDIVTFEGGFVLLAILGILLYIGMDKTHPHPLYILWWAIASFGSIIFVIKGGTVEYIFTLGEPAVAVFSAFFLHTFLLGSDIPWTAAQIRKDIPLAVGKLLLVAVFLIPTLCVKGGWLITRTMQNSISVMEFPEPQVKAVLYDIDKYSRPNDSIIAPPFYAYASGRRLAAHFSYDFMLAHAYNHEYKHFVAESGRDPGLPAMEHWQPSADSTWNPTYDVAIARLRSLFGRDPSLYKKYTALAMFLKINRLLNEEKIPLVITNRRNIVTWLPLLAQPLHDHYKVLDLDVGAGHPLEPYYDPKTKILYSREERLQFFAPRR